MQNDTFTAFFATPADEIKEFSRPGGFKGKSVSPYYLVKRLTERFGLCGKGWMVKHYDTRVVESQTGVVAVYVLLSLLYKETGDKEWNEVGPHYGGDVAFDSVKPERQRKNADGTINTVECDDEAFKKAYTDAFSKCCSWLGLGGDIHDGLCDGNKYLNNKPWDVDPATAKKVAVGVPQPPPAEPVVGANQDDKLRREPDPDPIVEGWTIEAQGRFATLVQTDLYNIFKAGGQPDLYNAEKEKWEGRKRTDPAEKVLPSLEARIDKLRKAMAKTVDAPAPTPAPAANKSTFQREADYTGDTPYADKARAEFQASALRFETAYKAQNLTDPQGLTKQMIAKVKKGIKFGTMPNETQDERRMMLADALQAEANLLRIP
jgi:hypothetical protein